MVPAGYGDAVRREYARLTQAYGGDSYYLLLRAFSNVGDALQVQTGDDLRSVQQEMKKRLLKSMKEKGAEIL